MIGLNYLKIMISYLKGTIQWRNESSVVAVVNNVGYEVFLSKPSLEKIKSGEEKEFFCHEYLRENARELYGFLTKEELRLFHDLMKVSGVGPKMALNVLSLGAGRIQEAITKGDANLLASISGVGKKTAQKIVLELKGVLIDLTVATEDSEAVDALQSLGYSRREAQDALSAVKDAATAEDKIKAALKILGRK